MLRPTMSGAATEDVWRRTNGDLLAFFRRRVRDEHTAQDLVQETFVRVHRGLATLKNEERVGAWVFHIARRVLAEHVRGGRATVDVDDHDVADQRDAVPDVTHVVESWLRPMVLCSCPTTNARPSSSRSSKGSRSRRSPRSCPRPGVAQRRLHGLRVTRTSHGDVDGSAGTHRSSGRSVKGRARRPRGRTATGC